MKPDFSLLQDQILPAARLRPQTATDRNAANKELDSKHPSKILKGAKCEVGYDKQGNRMLNFNFMDQSYEYRSSAIKGQIK